MYERYCACHPSVKAFVRWAKFEFGLGEIANAREVYESAVEQMALETDVDQLYVAFAKFEELAGEHARARVYAFALDNLPKEKARRVFQTFASFEKQHGDRQGIEDVVLGKRRVTYEDVRSNPENYDAWFDYARGRSAGDLEKTREVYGAPSPSSRRRRRDGTGGGIYSGSTTRCSRS